MTSILRDNLNFIFGSTELMILIKTTGIVALGLLIVWANRSARASVRHLVLTCSFACILLLPIATVLAPQFHFELEDPNLQLVTTELTPAPTETIRPANLQTGTATSSAGSIGSWSSSLNSAVWLIWGLGAALVLLKLAVSLFQLHRVRRAGIPSLEVDELLQKLAVEEGIQRRVDVLLHDDVDVPLTYGALRPVILLPADARTWTDLELRRVFLHELEHIKRRDWPIQVMARAVCALYWFQPLVWVAWRQLCLEAERASDDAVVSQAERADYAEQLVSLARRLSNALAPPALSMANRSDLSRRVRSILDSEQARGRVGLRWSVAAVLFCAVVLSVGAPGFKVVRTYAQATQASKQKPAPKVRALTKGLLEAVESGELKEVEDLLQAGADVNGSVEGDGTALIVAAKGGNKASVELLLKNGADPNVASPGDGNPLIMAADAGHEDIVELLLNHGAMIDQVVEGDENALIKSSGSGRLDVVKFLLSRGANVNARAWSGDPGGEWRTALMMARRGGHNDVVQVLISAGARD